MEISKLIHDDGYLDINLDVDIYKSENGEYELFISQDGSSGVSYDIEYEIKTTDDIAKCVKDYLETYCVESSEDEEE